MTVKEHPTLEIPAQEKCRWLIDILGLKDSEMEQALDIDYSTLRRWLGDETDRLALREARFDRLLQLTQIAKGHIRPDKMATWIRSPHPRLSGLTPAKILGDPRGLEMVRQALHDDCQGNPL